MLTPIRSALGSALVLALCSACAPDIQPNETTPGARAMFDPTAAIVPLPNDLLLNPATGRLALPIDPAVDSPLTQEIKANLGQLDGWLTSQTITLPFDAPLDPATIDGESVILVDVGPAHEAPVATRMPADGYYAAFNASRAPATAAPFPVVVKNRAPGLAQPPVDFVQGHRYAAVVTNGVRGADGNAIISHPALEMLKSTTPLVDANGHSVTILTDAQAAQLEVARSLVYAPVLDALAAAGIAQRADAVAFTVFSIQSGSRPVFNPTAIGTVLPQPNDISGPANAALDATPTVLLDRPYDVASAVPATRLYKLGATPEPVAITLETTATPDANGVYPLAVVPSAALEPATSYLVVLTDALQTEGGVPAQAGSYFSLVRARSPLLDTTSTPPTLGSPFVDLTIDVLILMGSDPVTASATDWSNAYNLLVSNLEGLEALRLGYAPLFEAAQAAGIDRQSIIVAWSFTTTAA